MRNELLPQYHVTVDIEYEVGFTFMTVDKKARLFVENNWEYRLEQFAKILRKDLMDQNNRIRMVTVNTSPDFHRANDTPTHRYIEREYAAYGGVDGYEKRPYVTEVRSGFGSGGSFPDVKETEVKRGRVRSSMVKAIVQEVKDLLTSEANRLTEAGKTGRFYLWNSRTEQDGEETYDTAEEAHQARRALSDEEADATYVKQCEDVTA